MCVSAALPGADDYLKGWNALHAGRFAEASKSFSACAGKSGPLEPYAQLRVAFCAAASGDRDGGIRMYEALIEKRPEGPWTRMARAYLGSLKSMLKDYQSASALYADALDFTPKPWWVDRYESLASEAWMESPQTVDLGCERFREVIANTRMIDIRIDAAKHLMNSASNNNRVVAAWGMAKSGECKQALDILVPLAPVMLKTNLKDNNWRNVAAVLCLNEGSASVLKELVREEGDSSWTRGWLGYIARFHTTSSGKINVARIASELLCSKYEDSDEAMMSLWWLAQRLAKDGERGEAIALYRKFARKYPSNSRADDALFSIAELSRAAGSFEDFKLAVDNLSKTFPRSSYLPKAWYWIGCAEEKKGAPKKAEDAFRRATVNGMGDFYAHRALTRLAEGKEVGRGILVDGRNSFLKAYAAPSDPVEAVPEALKSDPSFQRLSFFAEHGLEEAEWEALNLAPSLKGGSDAAMLYQAMAEAGLAFTARNFADAFGWDVDAAKPSTARLRLDFPRAYWPLAVKVGKETGVDPFLILAVGRQESTFRPSLSSSAGAMGIMQLMPGTARHLVKTDPDISSETGENLEEPLNSLRLGAHYIADMLDGSQGNIAYALASYNAGPGNCAKWKKQFGNVGLEDFIESIPFAETRDYVKIVLGNYAAYCSLYSEKVGN
jgi:soluble lytic murein transglycosylase-like protein/outer membrane protein assembly factor BamD (BamD/ComL family)